MEIHIYMMICILLMRKFTFSHSACIATKSMVNARRLNAAFSTDIVRYMACAATETPVTFYKCKVRCVRSETCIAMRYTTFCELCQNSDQPNEEEWNVNEFYISSKITSWFDRMYGKRCNALKLLQ